MTAVNRVLLVTVLFTAVGLPARATARELDDVIELRVMTYASDPENVRLAGQTAIDLLSAAGSARDLAHLRGRTRSMRAVSARATNRPASIDLPLSADYDPVVPYT